MIIEYRKKFLKELSKVPSEKRSRIEQFVFNELPEANSLSDLRRIEQMKGYPSCYKVRFGSYRIGLRAESDRVIMERVLHRKDIYRYFP